MDPFDLGLEDVSKYPECAACRKKSDGAVRVRSGPDEYLCGTHYDEWLNSPEYRGAYEMLELPTAFVAFVNRLRTTRYAACWTTQETK